MMADFDGALPTFRAMRVSDTSNPRGFLYRPISERGDDGDPVAILGNP